MIVTTVEIFDSYWFSLSLSYHEIRLTNVLPQVWSIIFHWLEKHEERGLERWFMKKDVEKLMKGVSKKEVVDIILGSSWIISIRCLLLLLPKNKYTFSFSFMVPYSSTVLEYADTSYRRCFLSPSLLPLLLFKAIGHKTIIRTSKIQLEHPDNVEGQKFEPRLTKKIIPVLSKLR